MHEFNKIFGLGLWRTGTTSLTRALRLLGIRCKHYPYDATTQRELWSESRPLTLLERYDAVTDISVVPFYKALDKLYPGSRFILTVRDEESWLASMQRQIERSWSSALMRNAQFRSFTEAICERVYGGTVFEKERLAIRYRQHVADVNAYFAHRPTDLLTINIIEGEGWETLCPFLSVPIPEAPFPRINASRRDPYAWDRKLDVFLETLEHLNADVERTILLDDARLGAYIVEGAKPAPFPEKNGRHAGRPKDGNEALGFLRDAIARGAQTLVIGWPALWWLDSYPEFAQMLREQCTLVTRNDVVEVFDLTRRAPGRTTSLNRPD